MREDSVGIKRDKGKAEGGLRVVVEIEARLGQALGSLGTSSKMKTRGHRDHLGNDGGLG